MNQLDTNTILEFAREYNKSVLAKAGNHIYLNEQIEAGKKVIYGNDILRDFCLPETEYEFIAKEED